MKLAQLTEQNLHWKLTPDIYRRLDPQLRRAGDSNLQIPRSPIEPKAGQVYVILGPRQVGKTTFLKQTIHQLLRNGVPAHQLLYLSTDVCHSAEEFRRTLRQFLDLTRTGNGVIFLDEVTRLPGWPAELKRLADEGVTDRFPIVATGSAAHDLRRQTEQLPGRGLEGNTSVMRPLSFRSFLLLTATIYRQRVQSQLFVHALEELEQRLRQAPVPDPGGLPAAVQPLAPYVSELDTLFRHYLVIGGYPRALASAFFPGESRPAFPSEGARPVVAPDVGEVLVRDVLGDAARAPRNDVIARNLLRALVEREGQRGSYNMLAQAVGVNHSTVIDYVSALEGSYVLHTLESMDLTTGKPRVKSDKKFHLTDPYLRIALTAYLQGAAAEEVSKALLLDEDRLGRAAESTVVSHLIANGEVPYQRDSWSFAGYTYDASKREVDCIIREPSGGLLGFEVKYQSDVRSKNVQVPPGLERCVILSKDDLDLADSTRPVIPVCVALALLEQSPRHL